MTLMEYQYRVKYSRAEPAARGATAGRWCGDIKRLCGFAAKCGVKNNTIRLLWWEAILLHATKTENSYLQLL